MKHNAGAAAYANMGVESEVMSASPYHLIVMLFDGAITSIRMAAVHMQAGRSAQKGEAISRALDIVNNGLLAAVDTDKGGEMAERLSALYEYISRKLLEANLHSDPAALEEARHLLDDIGSAWREIDPKGTQHGEQTGG